MVKKASTPPTAASTAEMYGRVREALVEVEPLRCWWMSPAAAGSTATLRRPAMRATELLIAGAMPACESSTAPSTVAVSGSDREHKSESEDEHSGEHRFQ